MKKIYQSYRIFFLERKRSKLLAIARSTYGMEHSPKFKTFDEVKNSNVAFLRLKWQLNEIMIKVQTQIIAHRIFTILDVRIGYVDKIYSDVSKVLF